jgi:hypothetical protein
MNQYSIIKPLMRHSLMHYFLLGYEPGGALQAILSNDLFDAVGRSDEDTMRAMSQIVTWIYSFAPRTAKGSREAVAAYVHNPVADLVQASPCFADGLKRFAELGDQIAIDALEAAGVAV